MTKSVLAQELSASEIESRVDILKRLRQSLLEQQKKFRSYLVLLEAEEKSIKNGDIDGLDKQVQLENSIENEIFILQKVIVPLDAVYRKTCPGGEISISKIQESVESIKVQVATRNEKNRVLLGQRMANFRQEIKSLRKLSGQPYAGAFAKRPAGSVARTAAQPLVDIST